STALATTTISGGVATFSTNALTVASHSIKAVYNGNGNFNTSTSGALTETVAKASTKLVLTSSANPAPFNSAVTFTATITVVAPGSGSINSGTVTFKDGTKILGTVTVNSSGFATLTTSTLSKGNHSINATYSGNGNFAASSQVTITQT